MMLLSLFVWWKADRLRSCATICDSCSHLVASVEFAPRSQNTQLSYFNQIWISMQKTGYWVSDIVFSWLAFCLHSVAFSLANVLNSNTAHGRSKSSIMNASDSDIFYSISCDGIRLSNWNVESHWMSTKKGISSKTRCNYLVFTIFCLSWCQMESKWLATSFWTSIREKLDIFL